MQTLHPLAFLILFFRYVRVLAVPLLLMTALLALVYFFSDKVDLTGAPVDLLGQALAYYGLFVGILLSGTLLIASMVASSYRFEATDSGFKKEYGILFKRSVMIPYDNIHNVDIYRTVLERMLGISEVHIQTAGSERVAAEGVLPGLGRAQAENLRDELVKRAGQNNTQ